MRGKRNEPAFTAHTAAFVAELRETDLTALEKLTTDNFFTLFSKAARGDLRA
jgi:TatD DNase family protein